VGGVDLPIQRYCQKGISFLPGFCGIIAIKKILQGNPSGSKDPREGVSTSKGFSQAVVAAFQDSRAKTLPLALKARWTAMVGELMLGQGTLSSDMMKEDGLLDAQRLMAFLDTEFFMVAEGPESGWVSAYTFGQQSTMVRELLEVSPSMGKNNQMLCIEDGHCEVNDWRPYLNVFKRIFSVDLVDTVVIIRNVNPYQSGALRSPFRGVPLSHSPSVADRMSQVDPATRRLDAQEDSDQGWSARLTSAADTKGRFPSKTQCWQPGTAPNLTRTIPGKETVDIRQKEGKNKSHEVGPQFVSCIDGNGAVVKQRGPDIRPLLGHGNEEVELRRMRLSAEQRAHLTIEGAKRYIDERGVRFPWEDSLPSPLGGEFTAGDGMCGFIALFDGF
jgi:hypothetical protein